MIAKIGAKDIYQPTRTLYFGLYQTQVRLDSGSESNLKTSCSLLDPDSPTSARCLGGGVVRSSAISFQSGSFEAGPVCFCSTGAQSL